MKNQGRQSDFEQIMLPHLNAAYNLARWLVRDPSRADDVVQDAYERACKYFASFRGGSGRAWLLQIVRNAAYSMLKAERLGMEVSLRRDEEDGVDTDLPDSSPGPDEVLTQRQDLAALDDALNALPTAWRECLILREVEELSYKQIAQIMEVPIGTVTSRLARARQSLQRGEEHGRSSPGNGNAAIAGTEERPTDARQ